LRISTSHNCYAASEDALTPQMMDKVIFHAGRAVDLSSPDHPQERHVHLMALHQLVTGYFNKGDYLRAADYAHRALGPQAGLPRTRSIQSLDISTRWRAIPTGPGNTYLNISTAGRLQRTRGNDHVILLHLRSRHNAYYASPWPPK